MTKQIDYQQKIYQGIQLINLWKNKQPQEIKESKDFKELLRVVDEIYTEKDYSEDSYLDIRYLLKPFDKSLPLQLKQIFNISTLDNYSIFIASRHFQTINDFINLELLSSKFYGNMTKFFYNPISLTSTTRKFFPNIQTLYIYSSKDELFENDKQIIKRETQLIPFYLSNDDKKQIEEWTGLKFGETIFNSEIDNWSIGTSVFNDKILGKKQLVFLIFFEKGEKIGYYLDTKVEINSYKETETNMKSFQFNLKSNEKLFQPMKFEIKDPEKGGYCLCEKNEEELMYLGTILLTKNDSLLSSYRWINQNYFNFNNTNKYLLGKRSTFQTLNIKDVWDGKGYNNYVNTLRKDNINSPKIFVIQMKGKN